MGSDVIQMIIWGVLGILILSTIVGILIRYRIADSNQILVVTGKVLGNKAAKTIHGGATFVLPIIQRYQYLDLTPIQIDVKLNNALSSQNIRINVPSSFTIAIGTEPNLMQAAAERLLDKNVNEISSLSRDIIFGQLRATIADMSIEEINKDRDKFITNIRSNVEGELKKIGLVVLNVNVTDITDESGYIDALGQKAASEAINKAKVEVANNDRDGEIGSAKAVQDQRIQVATADKEAVKGENEAKKEIAISNAELKVQEEESKKRETSAELTNQAQAEKDGYDAQKITQDARALQEEAKLKADILVPAEIAKNELIIKSEAEKAQEILKGEADGQSIAAKMKGEADGVAFQGEAEGKAIKAKGEAEGLAIQAKLEGEAKGTEAILQAKARGFKDIIESAGSAEKAKELLIIEQLPEIVRIQSEAIANIKIDKVTVWDSGNSSDGNGSTANFLNGMMKSLPPMTEIMENAGMKVPNWLGEKLPEDSTKIVENKSQKTTKKVDTTKKS